MFNGFKIIWDYRNILIATAKNDIKSRYASSLLGLVWAILYPILFISIYSVVYLLIFKIKLQNLSSWDYILIMFTGLVPWFGFSESIMTATGSVISNSSLIKNTLFPIDIIPVKAVLSSLVTQFVGLILIIIALLFSNKLTWNVIFVIPAFLIQILFMIGLAWILSSFNVLIRDVVQFMPILLLIILTISPIAYTPEMLTEELRRVMIINPLYYIIGLYRNALIGGSGNIYIGMFTGLGISMGFYITGYYIFSKLKVVFSDYV